MGTLRRSCLRTPSKRTEECPPYLPAAGLQHLGLRRDPATASPFMAPIKSSLTSSNTLGSLKWVAAFTMARARFSASAGFGEGGGSPS